ncbi:hypothetical protein BHE74_00014750 [Ensete ventricosum]|nr:hypothetical protein BHE74_00014750 [Ensete ventricosum]
MGRSPVGAASLYQATCRGSHMRPGCKGQSLATRSQGAVAHSQNCRLHGRSLTGTTANRGSVHGGDAYRQSHSPLG